ncbi:MAG TPA: hypothetical protein VMU07_03480 [Candidatus Paceibacterota bacterium]|nr:hypothetical protein [Candidatus Paceibacterota bacterium]
MLQLSEILKTGAFSVPDTVRQCRADLDAIERQIEEISAPAKVAEAEIGKIRSAIERGMSLRDSNYAEFIEQGGDKLIAELQTVLSAKISYLDNLRAEIQNLQEPLQITKSNLLAFLAQKQEKSRLRKEREELLREEKKSPINLARWVSRIKHKPTIWRVIAMAQKREDQVLNEICDLYGLKLVPKKNLSEHYARKYKGYRLHLYRRGYYLIPDGQPKGRTSSIKENHDQITADEHQSEAAR